MALAGPVRGAHVRLGVYEKWVGSRETGLGRASRGQWPIATNWKLPMSIPLLRQATASHSLSLASRALSRPCRSNSSLASQPNQPRHDPDASQSAPAAGPSTSTASSTSPLSQRKLGPTAPQDAQVLEPFSRVQFYLASINAEGIEPTRDDLDRYRPELPSTQSPKYAEVYTATLNTLIRSFTKEQLRKFLVHALGTSRHCSTNRKKADYAESILEQLWKWPKLADVEQAKRDKVEIVTEGACAVGYEKGSPDVAV